MSYILYINQNEKVTEISLPAVDNRSLRFNAADCELNIEVYDGVWKIVSTDSVKLLISGTPVEEAEITDSAIINIRADGHPEFAVIVHSEKPEENDFVKYSINGKNSITIGRADDNDIIIKDNVVGGHHCCIAINEGNFLIDDSKNGTFINGTRVSGRQKLNVLDTIYIAGHKIIFLGCAIAINKNDTAQTTLPEFNVSDAENTFVYDDDSLFSRAPRRIEPLDTETVEIEDPPAKQTARHQPLIFIIGPSVTMPIPILVSVLVNIASNSTAAGRGTMYLGSLLSVLLSAVIGTGWALAHQFYNKKQMNEFEKNRQDAYGKYIEKNKNLLEEKHEKNKQVLEKNYISSSELYNAAANSPELIWNRNVYQKDFLTIRIGKGKVKLPGGIAVSKQRFSLNDDKLCEHPHELHDKYEIIDDCVSTLNILQHKIIGVVGNKKETAKVANNIICQLAGLHCYTDIKIGFVMNSADSEDFSWIKWLPHARWHKDKLRLIGYDDTSIENVMYAVSSELARRAELEGNDKTITLPHIVFFCSSPEILQNSTLSRYMTSGEYLGISFILVYDEINKLPNECKAIIEFTDDFKGFYMLDGEINEENHIELETISAAAAEKFARKISGFNVNEISTGEIPASLGYYEMLGIGKVEHWNLIRRYKENRSYEGLKALIGRGIGDHPIYLDIHDKKQGPHGLVAGTTGSGKSETLQTFILSLAMNYSPDDVSFVLIDYKGGGMANVFKGLPHISGMITNLSDEISGEIDLGLTRRACSSLKSEIKRRQTIFGEHKLNHIDTYSRLYREGKVSEPIPHLIIISDEFAELKKEQPEFIKELVSVARVGRSLGIHLILATQKPSGVVDDEIWSNSRFKICLRVQDKQDSMGMLKRPDAAYITEAGRAYLQIGNDEMYELFQSGYSGADYVPVEQCVSASDSEAVMIEIDGSNSVVHSHKKGNSSVTELDAAVKYIAAVSKDANLKPAHSMWLPPLGKHIVLDDIHKDITYSDGIYAVYGVIDNHNKQKQYPAVIDLSTSGNLKIVGDPGSGKTTLLQTMLVSLAENYSPEQVNFYIMDFSSRLFKSFKSLPHCGGVVFEEDEEATARILKHIFEIIEERKILFDEADVGSYNEYRVLHNLPLTIVAIDNIQYFMETYAKYGDALSKLTRDCIKYGIILVVTMNNSSEINIPKMRNYITSSIVIRLSEKSSYTEYLRRNPEYVPLKIPGRGLVVSEGSILEYQAALPAHGQNEFERSAELRRKFESISSQYNNIEYAIQSLPEYSRFLKNNDCSGELLIGFEYDSLHAFSVPFEDIFCYCVSANTGKRIAAFMNHITMYTQEYDIPVYSVSAENNPAADYEKMKCFSFNKLDDFVSEIFELCRERDDAVIELKDGNNETDREKYLLDKYGRVFVLIDDMAEFCDNLYNKYDNDTASIIEEIFTIGKGYGIYFFAGYNSNNLSFFEASTKFKSYSTGIHIGSNLKHQSTFNTDEYVDNYAITETTGYSISNGDIVKLYIPEK